jgi:hypothetical protein
VTDDATRPASVQADVGDLGVILYLFPRVAVAEVTPAFVVPVRSLAALILPPVALARVDLRPSSAGPWLFTFARSTFAIPWIALGALVAARRAAAERSFGRIRAERPLADA